MESYNELTEKDEAETYELQKALDEGKDLMLRPGDFYVTKSLNVKKPKSSHLGTWRTCNTLLAPQDGSSCIHVKSAIGSVATRATLSFLQISLLAFLKVRTLIVTYPLK
jgi:hypothetical protein